MALREWIRENRAEIDACILSQVPGVALDDDERRLWVLNDEGLYLWAKRDGVAI